MHDFDINIKEIEQIYGIKITNPFYANSTLTVKEKLIKYLNAKYRKHRSVLSKIIPETCGEKYILDGYTDKLLDIKHKKTDYNAPGKVDDSSESEEMKGSDGKSLYFYLQYMNVYEVFMKEDVQYLREGLKKFSNKHAHNWNIGKDYEEKWFENINYFSNSVFDVSVASFSIKPDSFLKKYIDGFEIRMSGLTATLSCLTIKMHISEKMRNLLNEIAVQNMKTYTFCDVHNSVSHLREYKKVGCSKISGLRYKNSIKSVVETEIKWNVLKELNNYIDLPTFRFNDGGNALLVYETNIDGNYFQNFWESIGVLSRRCDFLKKYSGCISWNSDSMGKMYYIYDSWPDKNEESLPENLAYDIEGYYREYGVSTAILSKTRKLLSGYTHKVSFFSRNNGNIREWLSLKKDMENQLILSNRFLKEFTPEEYDSDEHFIYIENRGCSMSKKCIGRIPEDIKECRDTLESITGIVNANMDSLSCTSNYQIQHRTMIINGLSAVFALIAIMLPLATTTIEEKKSVFSLNQKIIICIILFVFVIFIGKKSIDKLKKCMKMKKYCDE